MTTEEFLALPENPVVDRALINGQLREYPTIVPVEVPMPLRGREQSRILVRLGYLLTDWQVRTGNKQGQLFGGGAWNLLYWLLLAVLSLHSL